jgi:hypothetical protein
MKLRLLLFLFSDDNICLHYFLAENEGINAIACFCMFLHQMVWYPY